MITDRLHRMPCSIAALARSPQPPPGPHLTASESSLRPSPRAPKSMGVKASPQSGAAGATAGARASGGLKGCTGGWL